MYYQKKTVSLKEKKSDDQCKEFLPEFFFLICGFFETNKKHLMSFSIKI